MVWTTSIQNLSKYLIGLEDMNPLSLSCPDTNHWPFLDLEHLLPHHLKESLQKLLLLQVLMTFRRKVLWPKTKL
jgi:hypothetical protein